MMPSAWAASLAVAGDDLGELGVARNFPAGQQGIESFGAEIVEDRLVAVLVQGTPSGCRDGVI